MRVGLTFDLRSDYLAAGMDGVDAAEFDEPETIAAIERAIVRPGLAVDRIGNARQLMAALVAGRRWDLVFNICEGVYGYGRESLVPALLDEHRIPYVFSEPLGCALTLHKAAAKHLVRDCGIPTPDFVVVESIADLRAIDLPLPLFVKPVAEGTGKGISAASRVTTADGLRRTCTALLARHGQSVLVERFLPGREFTVGIVGSGAGAGAIGTMEIHFGPRADAGIYTYANKAHWEERVTYTLMSEEPLLSRIEQVALDAWRALCCRDAGRVDIRLDDDNEPCFLEANALAGLHPGHSDLPFICRFKGIPYETLIDRILRSACSRAGLRLPAATCG